jgi:predicted dinucleotide-binding enzyme
MDDADVVFLCVPWPSVDETLAQLGDLEGVVLVDITNPYVDGKLQLHEGTSNAEIIQSNVPGARVVKGWNTIFSAVADEPGFGAEAPSVFLAGDDARANGVVAALARDMGFEPIDCGPLAGARDLERLIVLFGTIGTNLAWGRWALKVLQR